jgi:ribosome-binding protein aMBF1 (putative translation factor)
MDGEDPTATAIRLHKQESGLTWQQLADEMGLEERNLRMAASGRVETSTRILRKIGRYFQWSPWELGVAILYKLPPRKRKKREPR